MSQKTIRAALESRLKTWADAQAPAIPCAWENVPYLPTVGARYLRPYMIPAATYDAAVTADITRYTGIFQVSIYMPEGTGAGAAETIAESLIALYPITISIDKSGLNIVIERTPSIGTAMHDEGWRVLPVSIRYRVDKTT